MSAYAHTYGGPALFMGLVLLVGLPALYFAVLRRRLASGPARLGAVLLVWLAAWLVAYADVLSIARRAARLCTAEAGLHVHRTAVAAGFLGDTDFAHWSRRGFEFLEWRRHDGSLLRYTARGGAAASRPRSRYELVLESTPAGPHIVRRRWVVRALGKPAGDDGPLGEYVLFEIGPGWLDRLLIGVTGLQWTPPGCAGSGAAAVASVARARTALVGAVLRPPAPATP